MFQKWGLWALFSPFYQMVTMEMMTIRKISTSVLAVYFQVLGLYKVALPSSGRRKSYQWSKFSDFLFLTTLIAKVHSMEFGRVLSQQDHAVTTWELFQHMTATQTKSQVSWRLPFKAGSHDAICIFCTIMVKLEITNNKSMILKGVVYN